MKAPNFADENKLNIVIIVSVGLALVIGVAFSWLVIAAGTLQPNFVNILTQVVSAGLVISLLWLVIRRLQLTQQNLVVVQKNADSESVLLLKRSQFVEGATRTLTQELDQLKAAAADLPAGSEDTKRLNNGVTQLEHLLKRLQTISEFETKLARPDNKPVELVVVLKPVVEQYKTQFARARLIGDADLAVMGDASLLTEVFDSVIANAAQFAPKGNGQLVVECTAEKKTMQISVTDNGPGIPADKLAELFQPFSRADSVMTFDRPGQGLSLYIDKLYLESMGGSLSITSSAGKGTTATISLPLT